MFLFSFFKKNKEICFEREDIVKDLDLLVGKKKCFVFQGKKFFLNDINLETYIKLTNALYNLEKISNSKKISKEDLINSYFSIVKSVCPDFQKKDLLSLNLAQLFLLIKMIIDIATGKSSEFINKEEDKKKT